MLHRTHTNGKMTKKLFFLLLILAGTTPMTAQKNVKGLKNAFKKDFLIGVAVNQRNVSVKPQPTELQEGVFNWGGGLDFSREGTAMNDSIA